MQTTIATPIPSEPRFGLRLQLRLALGLLSFLVAAVAAATLWGILSIHAYTHQAVGVDGYLSRLASDVSIQTLLCRRYEKDMFLNLADVKVRADYLAKWNKAFADLNQAIGAFDASATTIEDKQLAETWRKDSAAYQAALLDVEQRIAGQSITSPADANAALTPSKDNIRRLTDSATKIAGDKAVMAQQSADALEESSTRTIWLVTLIVILALFVALTWSLLFPSRLMRPVAALQMATGRIAGGDLMARVELARNDELGILGRSFNYMADTICQQVDDLQQTNEEIKRLQEAETNKRRRLLEQAVGEYLSFAHQIAQGDLTQRIEVQYDGALGELGHGLNSMVASLHDITTQVQQAITAISAATAQILAATTEQAASSAEQSAAITETATSVEEVKVIAQQTAQQASQVAQASQAALPVAQHGQQAIAQTISGMSQVRQEVRSIAEGMHTLSGHSQAIGTIIATLSELADQITQLARNAAIESTVGGGQAADLRALTRLVRELAERAQSATGEVRTRLSAIQQATQMAVEGTAQSSQRVEAGTELVGQTGGVIRQLAADVEHGAQANMQMAVAAEQQLIGMEQIGLAITAIQQATAQALAGTQQAEQAAQDLHTLAQALQQAIAVYRL